MTGRNDPCPCGSGKKYKRCCGSGPSPTDDPKRPELPQPEPPQPLVLPKEFPVCRACGSDRFLCQEAEKGDVLIGRAGTGKPVLFKFERTYNTALYPVRLVALGDICPDCGTLRAVVIDKVKGKPRIIKPS